MPRSAPAERRTFAPDPNVSLQKMALAVWLLVRGFNPPEVTPARLEAAR
jgi:hypothetical protein